MRGVWGWSWPAVLLVACNFDPSGAGGGSGTTSTDPTGPMPSTGSSGSPTTVEPDGSGTTTSGGTTDDGTADETGTTTSTSMTSNETAESSSTGPGCPVGSEGCACDEGQCDAGLDCVDEQCVLPLCGNGDVDPGEECDDDNVVDGDGCEGDCTFTPGAAAVAAGDEHTCARFHSGDVVCWGRGGEGRLGYGMGVGDIGDTEDANAEGFVNTGGFVVQMGLGGNFTCVRYDDGGVLCWGANGQGRLGQGNGDNIGDDEEPGTVSPILLGGTAVDLAVGEGHACAVLDTGDVRCWGAASDGRLGYPMTGDVGNDETPDMVGPVAIGGAAEQVAAGRRHTCVLLAGGTVRCWGRNDVGQLGLAHTNTIGDDETPDSELLVNVGGTAVEIAAGRDHTCVLLDTGGMRCWGANGSGQLGLDHTNNVGGGEDPATTDEVVVGGNVISMELGDAHTCVVLDGGAVKCWGEADFGRLGYGDILDVFPPLLIGVDLGAVNATQVAVGEFHTCIRGENSEIMCWGEGERGRLGYGNENDIGDDEVPDAAGTVVYIP